MRSLSEDDVQIFNDSLDRCAADPRFIDRFYDRFIGGSQAVAAKFEGIDMERQKRALKASLYTAMLAADGNRAAIEHLGKLAAIHRGLGIGPALYDRWQQCLITTVSECGGGPDVRTERAWRGVLTLAIDIMKGEP